MNRLLQLAAACVVASSLATRAHAQETHNITLDRPFHIGQKMHVHSEGSQDFKVTATVRGRPQHLQETQSSLTFDSVAEVLEVDETGRPTRVAHTINTCEVVTDGHASVIAPKGSTLMARRGNGQTVFHVDGHSVDLEHQQLLEVVAGLDTERDTRDVLYGTPQPRTVGEQWPINTAALAEEFQRYTSKKVHTQDITGSSTLTKLMEHQSELCQVIHTRLSARNALPGIGALPPGVQTKRAKVDAHFYLLMPVDETLPPLGEVLTMDIDVVFSESMGPQGTPVDTRVFGKIEGRRNYTPRPSQSDVTALGAQSR